MSQSWPDAQSSEDAAVPPSPPTPPLSFLVPVQRHGCVPERQRKATRMRPNELYRFLSRLKRVLFFVTCDEPVRNVSSDG